MIGRIEILRSGREKKKDRRKFWVNCNRNWNSTRNELMSCENWLKHLNSRKTTFKKKKRRKKLFPSRNNEKITNHSVRNYKTNIYKPLKRRIIIKPPKKKKCQRNSGTDYKKSRVKKEEASCLKEKEECERARESESEGKEFWIKEEERREVDCAEASTG